MPSDSSRSIQAETATPEGVRVALYEDTWHRHDEMEPYLDAALGAVSEPEHRRPDPQLGRDKFYKQHAGPSRWLVTVVSFEQEPARIVTAFGRGQPPSGWTS
jgi:hypothetical protein